MPSNPDPGRVLQIAEQLDPILIERAYMRAVIELQEQRLEELDGSDEAPGVHPE